MYLFCLFTPFCSLIFLFHKRDLNQQINDFYKWNLLKSRGILDLYKVSFCISKKMWHDHTLSQSNKARKNASHIQWKQQCNKKSVCEGGGGGGGVFMAIASKVTSLRLSFSGLLRSSFFVYKNQSEFFSFVGCSISPHSR